MEKKLLIYLVITHASFEVNTLKFFETKIKKAILKRFYQ